MPNIFAILALKSFQFLAHISCVTPHGKLRSVLCFFFWDGMQNSFFDWLHVVVNNQGKQNAFDWCLAYMKRKELFCRFCRQCLVSGMGVSSGCAHIFFLVNPKVFRAIISITVMHKLRTIEFRNDRPDSTFEWNDTPLEVLENKIKSEKVFNHCIFA